MRRASRSVAGFRQTLGRLSGVASLVAGGGVGFLTAKSMSAIDAQSKLADRISASQKQLGGLDLAARRSGVSTQTLAMAMQRMTRRIGEAAQGTGEAKNALKTLGLDAAALTGMSADEQLRRVADALQSVRNGSQRVGLAMKIFDSEGVALLNTLAGGSKALDEYQKRAEQFGLAISRVDGAKIEEANDAFADVRDVFTGLFNQIAIQIAPLMTEAAQSFVDWATEGESAATKVSHAFREIVIPAIAAIQDTWDKVVGSMEIGFGLIHKGIAGIADFLGFNDFAADMREVAAHAISEGAKQVDRGVSGANFENLNEVLSGVFSAATERAAKRVADSPKGAALVAPKDKDPKIGSFREVDLRRIALAGAGSISKRQEVHDPANDKIIELLRKMVGNNAGAVAV